MTTFEKCGRGLCFLFIALGLSSQCLAQLDLTYYLPSDVSYDASIPTPKEVIGHEVGEWHVSHDKLVMYMQAVAAASNRVTVTEYARTYENRPLLLLTITSPANQNNIDEIKAKHVQLTDAGSSGSLDISNMPAVVWLGYSVHGNEPSGANAALVTAYYLAAAQGPKVDELLQNTVILLDPAINPDGVNRFASWVNTHKSMNLVSDPNNIEQNEAWPRGRTNHYWFDLNRDWVPLQHPESRGRIAKFHEWKPNVLTDHHEMGTNSTFFFQPGIPSRTHPLIPQRTYDLTGKISEYHARGLDRIGSLYYSRQSFDDFYFGKGSTYPDVQGAIGILFEQASSRSHAQDSENGLLRFPFTIRNHFTASLTTLEAGLGLREELLSLQRDFYTDAAKEAGNDARKAIVVGNTNDKTRLNQLARILLQHQIAVYQPGQTITAGGKSFAPDNSLVVPYNQQQYRLIKALFEQRTTFTDSLFYDVSAWTLPLAFNLDAEVLSGRAYQPALLGEALTLDNAPKGSVEGKSAYAYAFSWDGYHAPTLANKLLEANLRIKVATTPFTDAQGRRFNYGTIMLPVQNQALSADAIFALLQRYAPRYAIEVKALNTGLSSAGVDLGSNDFETLRKPKVMMLVSDGVTSYEAGEVWHLLDTRYQMRVSMVPTNRVGRVDLNKYNTIVLVSGSYGPVSSSAKENLKRWVQRGGTLVASRGGAKWLADNGITNVGFKSNKPDTSGWGKYADYDRTRGAQFIGGAIFNAQIDVTHPIGYGYVRGTLPLFKNNQYFIETPKNPYAYPVKYTSAPLLSGYISDKNLTKLSGAPAVVISSSGRGRVVSFADNPNFRAFWYGTNKLFANALFFGHIISGGTTR